MHRNFSHGSQKGKAVKANALSDPLVWADRTSCGLFELSSLELARAASERGHRCECADLAHCTGVNVPTWPIARNLRRGAWRLCSQRTVARRGAVTCSCLTLKPRAMAIWRRTHMSNGGSGRAERQRSSRAAAGALVARTCSS